MASDVRTDVRRHSDNAHGGGVGGTTGSTTNLVRLLREAEQGKGLEVDYSDALGEALHDLENVVPRSMRLQQKNSTSMLTLLGRVPSFGGRQRASRVIPCSPSGEEEKGATSRARQHKPRCRRHEQHGQNTGHAAGSGRHQVVAPSDGGLKTLAPHSPISKPAAPLAHATIGGKRKVNSNAMSHGDTSEVLVSSLAPSSEVESPNTKNGRRTNRGGVPRQGHEDNDSLRWLESVPPSTVAENIAEDVVHGADDGRKLIAQVTEGDVHNAYATLQQRAENSSSHRGRRNHFNSDMATGKARNDQSPSSFLSPGEASVAEKGYETHVGAVANGNQYARLGQVGRTPAVPTGVRASPKRMGVLARMPSTTQFLGAIDVVASKAAHTSNDNAAGVEPVSLPSEQTTGPRHAEEAVATAADEAAATAADGGTTMEPKSMLMTSCREAETGTATPVAPEEGTASLPTGATAQLGYFPAPTPAAASVSAHVSAAPAEQSLPQPQSSDVVLGRAVTVEDISVISPVEPTTVQLAAGLGAWAEDTVAVGRLVDEDSRRLADERLGETKTEGEIRRALERGMGMTAKTLPLSYLKGIGYLREAQRRGLEKTTKIMKRVATIAKLRAWQKWRQVGVPKRSAGKKATTTGNILCAAVTRGYLARRRVAMLRRERAKAAAQRSEVKRSLLQRRLVKVSAASRIVASCLIANASDRRRERRRLVRAAVAMVERIYIARKAREQGWREIVLYRKEHAAAGMIQRWTRGVLVRRRTPLDRRIRRMELNDARFALRAEVFVAHLVDHGAAVVIQKWWHTLPWRMKRLRRRYKHLLGVRATTIQRAYRRRLLRLKPGAYGKAVQAAAGKSAPAIFSSLLGGGVDVSGTDLESITRDTVTRLTGTSQEALARITGTGAKLTRVVNNTMYLKNVNEALRAAERTQHARGLADKERTTGRWTRRLSVMAGTIRRGGARTAKTTLKMKTLAFPITTLASRKKREAATTIAGAIMIRVASGKLMKKKKEKEEKAAIRIQQYVRDRKHNSVTSRRRDLFRSVCIQAMYRATAKGKAGVVVRALGRRYIARRRFMRTRRWVIGLQSLTRGWLGRRRGQSRRTYTQHLGEERAAGRVRWEQLIRRREDEELLNGARSEDLDDDLELHRTFMKYCRFGDRRNTGRMVVAKLAALCKDAGIIDKRFPVQRVEISFSRLKPKDLSHLPYSSFLAALDDIGTQHPDLRRLADATAAAAQEESVAVLVRAIPGATTTVSSLVEADRGSGVGKKSKRHYIRSAKGGATSPTNADGKRSRAENSRTPTTENRGGKAGELPGRPGAAGSKSPVGGGATARVAGATAAGEGATAETAEVECQGGFPPDDQRLLVLLQKYVFINSQAGKEACSEMEAEGRGARRRALDRLEAAAVVVQACVARGCSGRALAREASGRRELHRDNTRLNWAASLLQKRMRAFAARTRTAKMAVKRYYRCLDGLTGAEYYFDPKTGKSSWTKPKILGKFDISTAVVVPAGEEIMVPMCHECAEEVATEICADCDEDMLCHLCVNRIHRTGNASTHLRVPIEMCEECSFQVAVKHCQQCGDNFCVSCFSYLHRKGRIRRHTFEPLVGMCHDCGDRAQAFQCFGCDAEGRLLLCKRCLEARHHYLLPDQLAEHRIEAVGLRSLKVKRLKEEQSSRARELWMKAESAAAGKRSRDKKMLVAAIKIQTVWRGYLARKRRRNLMDQHLLWKMQRHKDDQIRKKFTYKVARYVGKARLLKSDTNQEIVLKQYPRWWQSTIMDIVRPTFGWHEGAKMVREQEFFAKKTKRKGRWKVHAARLRLAGELLRVRIERRKQRKYERLRDKAVGVYQDARAKGGVSADHKEELQQNSRKAKRAVQNQEQEREKAEERVKAAENALEALIGPFRLRSNVRAAVTKGMLMPFPVSMQKGKANARLEKGQNMREVLKWMPYGRRVRVEPTDPSSVYFLPMAGAGACSRPPPHAFGPFYVVGVKESRQNDKKDKAAAAAASALAGNLASKEPGDTKERPATGLGSGAAATTPAEGIGEGGTAVGADGGEDSVVDLKAQLSPVLILDRQWLLEEAPLCQAYAMPILPVIQKILMVLRAGIRDSSVVQVAIKVAVVGTHKHRDRLERWQTKFDDDSNMHARLERWAAGSEARSKRLMLRRRKLFDVEEGFQPEKRRVMEAVESVLALWTSLQEMTDFAKSAAATGLASTQGADGKGMIGGKLGREVVVQLFKKWVQSDDRTKVIIMHRSGKAANEPAVEVVQVVGYIKVDLDTPTPVLREFIRRFCGGWLNEHAKGDHFVMEDTTGAVVRQNREGRKLNATAMDMVQERINKTTRDTESVIFVQDERSRTDPDAEVELVLIPEKYFLDPESTPTFEDGVNADEEEKDHGDGDVDVKGARKEHREEDGGDGGDESDAGGRSSDVSSDQFSASIGSMGSDLEEDEDDPFAAMQKDLQDEKDAHNSATKNDTAGTNEAARG